MERFTMLPPEIMIDILSRLPARSIINCKCVCKSWLDLVSTPEFVKYHLSKCVPGIVIGVFSNLRPWSYRIIELTDHVPDFEHPDLHSNGSTKLHFPNSSQSNFFSVEGSADGLLLLHSISIGFHYPPFSLYLCNPITREYIDLYPQNFLNLGSSIINLGSSIISYGFGKSKISGKYKAVILIGDKSIVPKFECMVYTIGTGSWRRIDADVMVDYTICRNKVAFLNGNLHWLARDLKGTPLISCFDLETQIFTTFCVPPPPSSSSISCKEGLTSFEDCLCLCITNTPRNEIEIWLMKEYGVEKSWTKKCSVTRSPEFCVGRGAIPYKVFKDGDILLSRDKILSHLYHYSSKDKTNRKIDATSGQYYYLSPILYISSFLSLKNFLMENSIPY